MIVRLLAASIVAVSVAASLADDTAGLRVERDIPYAGTENPRQRLDLFLPERATAGKLPVIVFVHGGGWRAGDKRRGGRGLELFVRGGEYAGVSVGYRLTEEAAFPAQIHDCKAAIRWVRANADRYGLDPDRIGVWGTSAGGHLVSLLGTGGDVPELEGDLGPHTGVGSRVACVADYFGPTDFLDWSATGGGAIALAGSPITKLLGGPIPRRQAVAATASPVTHVTPDDPPVLIVHGTKDQTVPYRQGERFAAALRAAGVSCVLVPVEGGGHGVPPRAAPRLRAFFDKHLLGKDVEVSADPIAPGK